MNQQRFKRAAGVLLPVSSIPSPYGIGTFGRDARRWIDFLHDAGQHYWQILPLSPADSGGSPYQSVSAFAGAEYYIDLDTLCDEGLLDRRQCEEVTWNRSPNLVDYDTICARRGSLLREAFSRFTDMTLPDRFFSQNAWLDDYCLYMVIKEANGLRPWIEWEDPLRRRNPEALTAIERKCSDNYRYHAFVQYQFSKQWSALREYANASGIEIIGDIPIYVSLDSADVWANPDMFQLDGNSLPDRVAGYPPDALSDYGQLWGNPLYNWDVMAETGYNWWLERLRNSFGLYDVVRLDHFRGFERYFSIPYGAPPAQGQWMPGPGKGFIDAIKRSTPGAKFIAEDLGEPSKAVDELLAYSGFPGMKVLQFAFDPKGDRENRPYKYSHNCVVYPGTHDNDTVSGWVENTQALYIDHAIEYLGLSGRGDLPLGMIRIAMQSEADLAIIQMQDWLALGSEARMNTPSTTGGNNWRWRISADALSSDLAAEMARMTAVYDRD